MIHFGILIFACVVLGPVATAVAGPGPDCNSNGVNDLVDIAAGTSANCNGNAIPDECELVGNDCNTDGILDSCELSGGTATDCDGDTVLDGCEIANGSETDCDFNGVLDDCERPSPFDCNRNGQDDACDIVQGISNDFDGNQLPDECGLEQCELVWNGFENPPFASGLALNGFDSDGNGEAWSNFSGSASIVAGGCPIGLSTNAIRNTGDDSLAASADLTSELFAGDIGALPPATPLVRVSFDYQLEGDLNARYDHRMLLLSGDTGQVSALLWFGSPNSDLGVNGAGAGDDATPGQVWVLNSAGILLDTGVALDIGVCHSVLITFNTVGGLIDISIDNQPVFSGAAISPTDRIDRISLNAIRHVAASPGGPDLSLTLDNFERCVSGASVSCSIYDSVDCDGNNVCDVFETGGDSDADGVLDICEDYCDDCNNNGLRDAAEIAAGTEPDANSNGIIDFCEATTASENFGSFVLTSIDDERGWSEIGDTISVVVDASFAGQNPAFPTSGNQFLIVSDSPAFPTPTSSFLFSPRSELLEEDDIETWCWDMFVTSNNFGSLFVEITDLCREFDGPVFLPSGARNLGGLVASVNTGLEFRGSAATPPNNAVLMLSNPGGGDMYSTVLIGQESVFGIEARTACIKIRNDFGTTEALYGPLTNDPRTLQLIAVGQIETGKPAPPPGPSQPAGGDKQWIIRTDGVDNGTDFWFDNLRYIAHSDCDKDGIRDSIYIDLIPQMDANTDGVLDTCQDCNNDCGSFPVASVSCLDAQEIALCPMGNVACADCNSNGIPDECDVDPLLPILGALASCPPLPGCLMSRRGGGSCDADGDAVPDECQVAAAQGTDCNYNGCIDGADISMGTSVDVDGNLLPDECDPDCNHNGVVDALDISAGTSSDTGDGVPDECCPNVPNPDFDADGDVDAADYQRLQQCAGPVARSTNVPGGAQFVECGCADLDDSGVVDEEDVRRFQQNTTGP